MFSGVRTVNQVGNAHVALTPGVLYVTMVVSFASLLLLMLPPVTAC